MEEKLKEITAIENKYDMALFRMGLTHLVDVGVNHFTDSNVEADITQILVQADEDKSKGVTPTIAPDFQCDIIRCAAELSKFSIWTLFLYIKKHIHIGC